MRSTRIRKFRSPYRMFFLISKLVIIWYLLLFTGMYLNATTDADFTESYEIKNSIHAYLEPDEMIEEKKPDTGPAKEETEEKKEKDTDSDKAEEPQTESENETAEEIKPETEEKTTVEETAVEDGAENATIDSENEVEKAEAPGQETGKEEDNMNESENAS